MIAISIITTTGEILPVLVAEEHLLDGLYSYMKCSLVQIVYAYKSELCYMLADEEGLLKSKELNHIASAIVGTPIVGHVAIIQRRDFQ